jgi:hypothetical protein
MNESTKSPLGSSVDSEIVAAIAVAVALMVRKSHRVLSVQESSIQLDAPVFVLNPWSMEGRFQHFGSHKVR